MVVSDNSQEMINKAIVSLIDIARNTVGSHLSKFKDESGNLIPTVLKARQNGLEADYTYIVVDLLTSAHTDEPLMGNTIDTENESVSYHTAYKLLLRYSIYGGNALSIATQLHSWFSAPLILNKIICDTCGGGLEEVMEVLPMHKRQATEYREGARFDLTVNIPVTLTTYSEGFFDSITINGEVNSPGSLDSTQFTITLPENNGE